MHLGPDISPRLEQKLAFKAIFRVFNLSDGAYLALLVDDEKDQGHTKRYANIGRCSSDNPPKKEIRDLIKAHYDKKKDTAGKQSTLQSMQVPYEVFDGSGKLFDKGYI